jgi:prepilin-type N-terminal cleavage/methylation domain-containing protein
VTRARRQRGFTLIELMVALVVSSLLVGMILSIFSRMSIAYREQAQVAQVQQLLSAARNMLTLDAKQAGFQMSDGFRIATDTVNLQSPVRVINSATGPDQVALFYADASTQARVLTVNNPTTGQPVTDVVVDAAAGFTQGDLVVLVNSTTIDNPLNPLSDAKLASFKSCVLQIRGVGGASISFTTALPWGTGTNTHCATIRDAHVAQGVSSNTMLFKFVAHAYRIDPTRPTDGVLQQSPTGGLVGAADWVDLGYGFTDLQLATQVFDNDGIDTPDPDLDPKREWYSGDDQTNLTAPAPTLMPLLQLGISLTARTDRDVEGITTAATPALTVAGIVSNNQIGDHPAVQLDGVPDASRPAALTGSRIYRYTSIQVDLRNMGVGR